MNVELPARGSKTALAGGQYGSLRIRAGLGLEALLKLFESNGLKGVDNRTKISIIGIANNCRLAGCFRFRPIES
ncbi:MAG: hypothetical protein ACOCTI_05410 [Phycisphaeraceae bacterium]